MSNAMASKDWQAERIKQEARDHCPACEQALWLTFFFDGFGYSDRQGPASNVVKIYQAAKDDPTVGFRALYYPGLGAPFDPETRALAAAVGGKLASSVSDHATGTTKDSLVEHVSNTVEDAWQRSRGNRDQSLFGRAAWTFGEVRGELGKDVRILRHPPRAARKLLRYLRREWKSYWAAVAAHPWRAAKETGKQVAELTVGAVAEGIGPVRDSALASALFNTGVDTRLKVAAADFEREVREAKRNGKVKHINVAVFGYDMGGGLALAFVNRLMEEVCEGGRYEGAKVQYRFMGLFDCVTNRYDDNLLTGYMPLSNEVSSQLRLPKEVEYCVHFAAAHEQRFYKPLTFIGGEMDNHHAKREEMLFPGSQIDVGGGSEDGEDGVSNHFSRLPLAMMLARAWGRGVPVFTTDELRGTGQAALAAEFMPTTEISEAWNRYRKAARRLATEAKTVTKITSTPILLPGQPGYGDAQAPSIGSCSYETATTAPTTIEDELKGHIAILIRWLRLWFDQNRQAMEEQSAGWLHGATGAPHDLGRYSKLADEIDTMARLVAQTDTFGNALYPQDRVLYDLWNWDGVDADITALYPFFMRHLHDSMAECKIESAFGDFIFGRHYLNRRPMNQIATAPDPSFLEGLVAKYNSMVEGGGNFVGEVVEDWSGR